jgi:hypothetical protein
MIFYLTFQNKVDTRFNMNKKRFKNFGTELKKSIIALEALKDLKDCLDNDSRECSYYFLLDIKSFFHSMEESIKVETNVFESNMKKLKISLPSGMSIQDFILKEF